MPGGTGGALLGAHIEIGATLSEDGRPGAAGVNADSFGAGYLGQLHVGGSLPAARVHVGVDPVNGVYDDGDDLIIGGPASRIQTIVIGGRVDGASRIVAGALPASLHIGGRDTAAAVTAAGDGTFRLSKAAIDTMAGGALAAGAHSLLLTATDKNGIATTRAIGLIYDATAPGVSGFTLTQSSDTGTMGDNITAATRVGQVGVTEAGATATLGAMTALAGGNGGFEFADVVLVDGANKLSVTAADLAGNTGTTAITVTRSGTVSTGATLTWNQAVLEAVRKALVYPEVATQLMAMVPGTAAARPDQRRIRR